MPIACPRPAGLPAQLAQSHASMGRWKPCRTSEATAVATAASRRWIMRCALPVWLVVALAVTLLGCGALAPVADPLTPVPDAIARGHDDRDRAAARMRQARCMLDGDVAADYVLRRDVQHESFAQVF